MKKFFIPLLILFSFFFIKNVNAYSESYVFDYDSWYSKLSDNDINLINNIINYNTINFPDENYIIYADIVNNNLVFKVVFYKDDVENIGSWFLISNKGNRNYSGTIGIMSGTPVNNKITYQTVSNTTKTFTDLTLQNYSQVLSSFNNTYDYRNYTPTITIPTSSPTIVDFESVLFLYSSFDIKTSYYLINGNVDIGYAPITIKYNNEEEIINNGDSIMFLFNYINYNDVVINKVVDLGDNTFGFYQNMLSLNLTSLSGSIDGLSIICEEDRLFDNNYCNLNYSDLIQHNSDITTFNNYGASFTQTFGSNSGYLYNNKYYLYSFRILKPFVPQVGNIFINTLKGTSNQVNILGVYLQDGGSYTDYVVKFSISNSDYDSTTNLNDIMVVFRDGLSSYYSVIPSSFSYSVYRSFKLQFFDTEPTVDDVNSFYNYRDLSTIDGINGQHSFFTDTDFDTFGFGGIVTAPFRFLYSLENYESCSDISLPFPHSNNTFTLSCVRKNIPSSLNPLIVILQVVLSGIICYRVAVGVLHIIKDLSSPEDSSIEVVDL